MNLTSTRGIAQQLLDQGGRASFHGNPQGALRNAHRGPPRDNDGFFLRRRFLMDYPNTQLFIDGRWQDAADGRTLPVFNPATGREIGRVAHAGRTDLDRALEAAQKGFETWRDTTPAERSKVMRRAAGFMRERAGDIARLLTQEQGKPLAEAKGEALASADIIEWFAEE